jgi:hypothetical protein
MKPSGLRYSQILGSAFYHIGLSQADCDKVDTHFTAAAHHRFRMFESKGAARTFHMLRYQAHLKAMMLAVYSEGDFSKAVDESGSGLDFRESWNPDRVEIPDYRMFNSMTPDHRFLVNQSHPSDHSLDPEVVEVLELIQLTGNINAALVSFKRGA